MEKITEPKCKVCGLPGSDRDLIDEMILTGSTAKEIIALYPSLNAPNISTHRTKHVVLDVGTKLREIANKALLKGTQCNDVGSLIRLLEYEERHSQDDYKSGNELFLTEFEDRFTFLESFIEHFYPPNGRDDYIDTDDMNEDRASLLRVIKYCMTVPMSGINKMSLGGLLSAVFIDPVEKFRVIDNSIVFAERADISVPLEKVSIPVTKPRKPNKRQRAKAAKPKADRIILIKED